MKVLIKLGFFFFYLDLFLSYILELFIRALYLKASHRGLYCRWEERDLEDSMNHPVQVVGPDQLRDPRGELAGAPTGAAEDSVQMEGALEAHLGVWPLH